MKTGRRPHVFLICIDALRYDCLNWQPETPYFQLLGMPRRLGTPTLDDFAAQSVRFIRAVSHAGYTPLSLATTLTGTYARTHGVVDFQNTTCRPHVRALPALFAESGYRTAAICGPDWFSSLGLTPGVDRIGDDERIVVEMLAQDAEAPLFSFIHFNDVHSPYGYCYWDDPAAENRDFALFMWTYFGLQVDLQTREFVDAQGRRAGFDKWDQVISALVPPAQHRERVQTMFKCYLHGLEKFDQVRLARFVAALRSSGAWDNSIVCIFADHGEIVSPRLPWVMGHGKFLLEQLQRVPLLLKAPGVAAGDVQSLVGLVDIAPTVLELAGLDAASRGMSYELDGRSLVNTMQHDRPAQPAYYQEGWSVLVAEQKTLPVLYQRALRTQDDRKYLALGDALDANGYDALDESAYLTQLVERGMGEIAHARSCEELRTHLRNGLSRRQLAAAVLSRLPRYQFTDVKRDPLEQQPIAVAPGSPAWSDFEPYAARLDALRGVPNYNSTSSFTPEQEQRVLEHLGALGYVEA